MADNQNAVPRRQTIRNRNHNRKPKIVAIVPSFIASCQIGVVKPLSALAARGAIDLDVRLETRAAPSCVLWADLVVFCRNTEPGYAHLLNEAVAANKPVIYDLDDNFWDVPFETDPELARYHRLPLRIQQLEQYLRHAGLVRVYNPVMRDMVSRFNHNVKMLKAGFDFSLLPRQRKIANAKEKIQLVYATSRTVDNQYKLFLPAVLKALDQFRDNIQFTVWGCGPGDLVGHRGIKVLPLVGDYDRFLRHFSRAGFDIGFAPMEDTLFHRSKANTKFRDYGACRVAGIYSDVEIYSTCVEQGKTGLLVNNDQDSWFKGICRLVENQKLRESIQDAAYDKVFNEYRQQLVEDEWWQEIGEILASDTSYSLVASPLRQVSEVLIRADFPNLSAIRFPAFSPGDNYPVGKLFLEIITPEGNVLRQAASTVRSLVEDGATVQFSFNPIWNSQNQELVLRFISVPESNIDNSVTYWLPTAAFIQMIYLEESATTSAPAVVQAAG